MIFQPDIQSHRGPALWRGDSFLYLAPHPALLPHIACYTLTLPQQGPMTDRYTVMPTASSTMVFSVGEGHMVSGLRGVNSRASVVGAHANQFRMLLLVEFHPGGLYPFVPMDQDLLLDKGFAMDALDPDLDRTVRQALESAQSVDELIGQLNALFLARLERAAPSPTLEESMAAILQSRGAVGSRAPAQSTHYSQKHLGRLFRRQVGLGVKTFARIVRVNHALRLLEGGGGALAHTAQQAGYFDQPHFIRDFKEICGLTPRAYLQNRSIFYNDTFKM